MSEIERPTNYWALTITNSLTTTEEMNVEGWSALKAYLPAGYLSTTFTFYSWDPRTQNYLQEKETGTTNNLSLAVAANGAYPLPDQLFAAKRVKVVSNNAGDNAVVVTVVGKA